MTMNRAYWENRYARHEMGWDIGYPSPPLTTYIDGLEDTSLKILIPGAGYGYEVAYLHNRGFNRVYALDIAEPPLQHLREKLPGLADDRLILGDFFALQEGNFDLILEQTFFCALPPSRRPDYVLKMKELLVPGGRLAGVLFDFPLSAKGPPFGGSLSEYQALFSPHFRILKLERAYNSIPPRQGTELFFIFER